MSKKTVVTIVSDQTIPNLLMVRELKCENAFHLLISTKKMQDGPEKWLRNTIPITDNNSKTFIVNQFSIEDITTQLSTFDFSNYDSIIVNLTGGTKIMAIGVYDFFKEKENVTFYYITSHNNEYQHLSSVGKIVESLRFNTRLTIEEYFSAYGFEIKTNALSGIDFTYTCQLFDYFNKNGLKTDENSIDILRECRRKGKKSFSIENKENNEEVFKVNEFLTKIGFPISDPKKLSKKEISYLTGDWFEEYIGLKIKEELQLEDTHIKIGMEIIKSEGVKENLLNHPEQYLPMCPSQSKEENKELSNELDVAFMYENRLYVIECKTSLVVKEDNRRESKEETVPKERLILSETIYKADSLKSKFGLYAKIAIITLMNFDDYVKHENEKYLNSRCNQLKKNILRCNVSNIKLIDQQILNQNSSIYELINKKGVSQPL